MRNTFDDQNDADDYEFAISIYLETTMTFRD